MMLKPRLSEVRRRGIGCSVYSLAFATRSDGGLKPKPLPNVDRLEGEAR